MNHLVRGGLAGALATVPMTAVIALGGGFRHGRTPPPERIAETAARRANVRDNLPGPAFSASWLIAHVGYGGACGALFSLLGSHLPGPPITRGLTFGALVWGISYGALMPALHLYPPPHHQSPRQSALMLAAHVVYGATTGLLATERDTRLVGLASPVH